MEIYKDLNSAATQQFEKLLNSQLSKNKIQEGKIIDGKVTKITNKYEGDDWLRLQIHNSGNFVNNNKIWTMMFGGINYQIEHHLFPRIAHYYYPDISPYVKDWCKENNIKYVHYPTIKENVLSLISYLKKTNS